MENILTETKELEKQEIEKLENDQDSNSNRSEAITIAEKKEEIPWVLQCPVAIEF